MSRADAKIIERLRLTPKASCASGEQKSKMQSVLARNLPNRVEKGVICQIVEEELGGKCFYSNMEPDCGVGTFMLWQFEFGDDAGYFIWVGEPP